MGSRRWTGRSHDPAVLKERASTLQTMEELALSRHLPLPCPSSGSIDSPVLQEKLHLVHGQGLVARSSHRRPDSWSTWSQQPASPPRRQRDGERIRRRDLEGQAVEAAMAWVDAVPDDSPNVPSSGRPSEPAAASSIARPSSPRGPRTGSTDHGGRRYAARARRRSWQSIGSSRIPRLRWIGSSPCR